MKINNSFIVHLMDGKTLLVPTASASFHGLVEGGETVGFILNCLKTETTEEKIVDALAANYRGDRELMAEDVHSVIVRLRSIGALDEQRGE